MKLIIPEKLNTLAKAVGGGLYVVGGACRDALADLPFRTADWDIAAPISGDKLSSAAEKCGFFVTAVYKNTGTVHLKADGVNYEFASFRTDKYVRGVHTPSDVVFTDDIRLDARRRDFKCNAVYFDIAAGEYVDPLGGIPDIKNREISAVADPFKVFSEDGLRLMRLCRIAATTGFSPTKECMDGARANASLIGDIAPERIWAELMQILSADGKYNIPNAHYVGVELLKESGVLKIILPELAAGDGMPQRPDYHNHDVLEHSLRCVMYADPSVRLAALLHDAGKPYCYKTYGNFHWHETEGARIAEEILKRFKAPKKLTERVIRLIKLHMYDMDGVAAENKVRKFIVKNYDILDELLLLKQADYSACKDKTDVAPFITRCNAIMQKMKSEGVPFTLKELKIRGDELIAAGIPPSEVGATLNFLLEQAAMHCVKNAKKELLAAAIVSKKYYKIHK